MRVSGSLAFVAAARGAFLVEADQQDRARRLFTPIKNNIGPDDKGLAFRIEAVTIQTPVGPLSTSRVVWESDFVSATADEIMQSEMAPQSASALAEATEWLQVALAAGPVPAVEGSEMAKAAGITVATLRRAKTTLGVITEKSSMKGGWQWSLPTKVLNTGEAVQEKSLSPFGNLEHLQEMADKL
jgi:hypothetical protein